MTEVSEQLVVNEVLARQTYPIEGLNSLDPATRRQAVREIGREEGELAAASLKQAGLDIVDLPQKMGSLAFEAATKYDTDPKAHTSVRYLALAEYQQLYDQVFPGNKPSFSEVINAAGVADIEAIAIGALINTGVLTDKSNYMLGRNNQQIATAVKDTVTKIDANHWNKDKMFNGGEGIPPISEWGSDAVPFTQPVRVANELALRIAHTAWAGCQPERSANEPDKNGARINPDTNPDFVPFDAMLAHEFNAALKKVDEYNQQHADAQIENPTQAALDHVTYWLALDSAELRTAIANPQS